jgi:hypothetical protein
MGYLNSTHIKKFVKGRTIVELSEKRMGTWLKFDNGESLQVYWHPKEGIIATPYRKDGEVKQSTEIEAEFRLKALTFIGEGI